MRIINSENYKMSDRKFCPFWNVGFCKFHDKCNLELNVRNINVTEKVATKGKESNVNLATLFYTVQYFDDGNTFHDMI